MARSQSPGDLQDYWKEFEDIESSTKENDGDDDETAKTPDEGELEIAWLQSAGYGVLVSQHKAGKELAEDEIQALTSSLPRNHAAVVRKRVDTLNATLRKKQKYTTKIDVRNIFPQQRISEPVVFHSEVVEEPEEKPTQISMQQSTGSKFMPVVSSTNSSPASPPSQPLKLANISNSVQPQSSAPQSSTLHSSSKGSDFEYEDLLIGLQIGRSDSQGSESSTTSPSRSRSSSCNTLDSVDSGLESASSNLNKENSSSRDSLDFASSSRMSFSYPNVGQTSPIERGKVFTFSGQESNENPGFFEQSPIGSPNSIKRPTSWLAGNRKRKHKTQPKMSDMDTSPSDKYISYIMIKTPKSPVSPRNEIIHPEFGNRQNRQSKAGGPFAKNKGGYSMSGMTEELHDNVELGVEMLRVQQKETYNNRNSQLSPISDSDITFEFSIEENGKDSNSQENRIPSSPSTDNLPNFSLVPDKLGLTRIQDLSESDLVYVQKQALLELTDMYDKHNITYGRRRTKKKYKESGLFGVPLQSLLDHDQKLVMHTKIPIVFSEILKYLVKNCLETEGILRIPGSTSRVKQLREELEEKLYNGSFIWGEDLTSNDVAALMKQFLRELPVPLLTDEYIDAFAQVEHLPDRKQQLHALNLLILLLPNVHRDTLHDLLEFLEQVISHSTTNRMSLNNVSMIMAPNLFLAPKVRSSNPNKDKRAWEIEIKMAAGTSNIMKMLIKYRHIMWTIPTYLVALVRRQYELEQLRRNKEKTRMKFLAKKDKTEVYKKPAIKHENDFQEGVIRVQAHHLTKSSTAIQLDEDMTAGDIVSKFRAIQGSQTLDPRRLRQNQKSSQTNVFADPRNFLSAGDDTFLFEKGGNIGERCLPNNTNMLALYRANPNAEWLIKQRENS